MDGVLQVDLIWLILSQLYRCIGQELQQVIFFTFYLKIFILIREIVFLYKVNNFLVYNFIVQIQN